MFPSQRIGVHENAEPYFPTPIGACVAQSHLLKNVLTLAENSGFRCRFFGSAQGP